MLGPGGLALIAALILAPCVVGAATDDEIRLREIAGNRSYLSEVQRLMDVGVNPNVPDESGRTAVHYAAASGADPFAGAQILDTLLRGGRSRSNRGETNVRDRDGNTPLHLAAECTALNFEEQSIASIRTLLRHGAEPDVVNGNGNTPLHLAVRCHRSPDGVRSLLGAGASASRANRNGDMPLHAAVGPFSMSTSSTAVVEALLRGGAVPDAAGGNGLTPLQLFVRHGPDEGGPVTALLRAGADPNRKYPGGDAPLHIAIRQGGTNGKVDVVRALLRGNADPCIRDANRYTPYQIATEGGAIHSALDRAGGYDRACDKKGGADSGMAEVDRMMRAAKRANVRSGPGTNYGKVGLLEAGQRVRVTGESREWLRIDAPTGGEGFVFRSLLRDDTPETAAARKTPAPAIALEPKCTGTKGGPPCWLEVADKPGCYVWIFRPRTDHTVRWSGSCVGGKVSGRGEEVLTYTFINPRNQKRERRNKGEGRYLDGKRHGDWVFSSLEHGNNYRSEGPYVNGKRHGHWVIDGTLGFRQKGPYVDGKRHGKWVFYDPDKGEKDKFRIESNYVDGKRLKR